MSVTEKPAAPEISAAGASGPERAAGFDALRAALTLLVVFHHTAITYGATGGWYYREIEPSQTLSGLLLAVFCATNQAWFMGLFFLLAGYYTPAAYERRGPRAFLAARLTRLGLPLVAYVLLLSPITVALAETAKGESFADAFVSVWRTGRLGPGPMWFVEALLIFTGAFVAWRLMRGEPRRVRARFPSDRALFAAALAVGAAAFALRLVWPVGVNVGFLQLGYFASYVALFAAGCAAAPGRLLENIPAAAKRRWLRIAWTAFPVLPAAVVFGPHVSWLAGRSEGGMNRLAFVYAFWEPFVAVGFILALLVLFDERFANPGPIWRRLSRRAFLIYVIHPPILVGAALISAPIAAPALVKFAVTGSLTCLVCYLVAGALLRIPAVARIV